MSPTGRPPGVISYPGGPSRSTPRQMGGDGEVFPLLRPRPGQGVRMLWRLAFVLLAGWVSMGASCRPKPPNPIPTPTPGPTPVAPVAPEMLLTQRDAKIWMGQDQVHAFMAVQCCMEPLYGWPLFDKAWVDYTKPYGVNFYHARLGPFYGDANHEAEWKDVGGPYAGGPGSDWNPAFWEKVRELAAYAASKGAWVEVNTTDTWYCKHAQWGDQEMPWSKQDVDACGRYGSGTQEQWLRKIVSELGRFGNVIWLLDNEGGEIDGNEKSWWIWARDIIRDEEQKGGLGLRHIVGVNAPDYGDVGDYVATHSKQALLEPLSGRWTINNERNPAASPEQEAANFARAREAGLAWAFWRAEMSQAQMVETLNRMRDVASGGGGPIACFPPDQSDEGAWKLQPIRPCQMCAVVDQAKDKMGNPCGTNAVESGEKFAATLRSMGHCAGFYSDQVSILAPDGLWEEHHVIAWTDGCYTQTARGFKNVWKYLGTNPTPTPPPPTDTCPAPQPPKVSRFVINKHNNLWDATAKTCDKVYCASIGSDQDCCPARLEGDPNRSACEKVMVGGDPVWSGDGQVNPTDNPYQVRCRDCSWVKVCNVAGDVCETEQIQ